VGLAYHAGALRALEEVGGFRADDADVVVGTSAGSLVGAAVRSGLGTEDLWQVAVEEHDDLRVVDDAPPWSRVWETNAELVRRLLGSVYVVHRSVLRFPVPGLPSGLRRLFPGGFVTITDAAETLSRFMPAEWPSKPLWLVTVDVRTGRRVILGRRNPPRTDLHTAVQASCAIPGFFQPVRVGNRTLVDGGVHSTTNLDLTAKVAPEIVVAVVPMAFDPDDAGRGRGMVVRRLANARLAREVAAARAKGARVLLVRPGRAVLGAMGVNLMRHDGNERVAQLAYESAAHQLQEGRAQDVLAQLREIVAA
jgi:NTE family protein